MIERDELTGRFLSRPLIERFHEGYEVDEDLGCWVWIKSRRPRGPGALKRGAGVNADAHRVAYELMIGPIPLGTFVCHRCDNPPCVNPDHLFLGTGADNVRDRDEKGRQAKGQGHGRAKLSEHDVLDVLASDASNKALGEKFRRIKNSNISDPGWLELESLHRGGAHLSPAHRFANGGLTWLPK